MHKWLKSFMGSAPAFDYYFLMNLKLFSVFKKQSRHVRAGFTASDSDVPTPRSPNTPYPVDSEILVQGEGSITAE